MFLCFLGSLTRGADLKLELESNFLNLPVTYDEEDYTSIEIQIDGKNEFYFDLFLADREPDFWVFLDVSALGT
jgi:hypothetical protein